MKTIKNIFLASFYIAIILLGAFVPSAKAEEITVTGNGASSTNDVTVAQTNTSEVSQSNTSDITNNVTTDTNTGGNTASSNNGGQTTVATGDANARTSVSTAGNVSIADVTDSCNCQSGNNSMMISGNASGSTNTIANTNVSNTNISTNNAANVTNNIAATINTGNNIANYNDGDVHITTGNASAKINILNGPLNITRVTLHNNNNLDLLLKIAGNGTSSINAINSVRINNLTVSNINIANIINNLIANLNTGNNSANFNNGDVSIDTGDAWADIRVNNLANLSEVIIDCGCEQKPNEEKPIIPPAITSVSSSTSQASTSTSSPSVQGAEASLSQMLPTTGASWLFFALIGNILMFFLGAYLRLRSGRSPGFIFAI